MPVPDPKPICFMVMPFGVKPTMVPAGTGPAKVDFDQLWEKLFKPLIVDLGYEPVRADADLGASIIRDMLERLALSDLVLADVSIPNANVFYEVGIRHAACETGCVLVAASWSRQPFDTQSMRYEPFDLAGDVITDQEAATNRARLKGRVERLAGSKTPCFELDGFPKFSRERATSFRDWLRQMNEFNTKLTAIRLEPASESRRAKAAELASSFGQTAMTSVVAFELLKLLRDTSGWTDAIALVERLPEALRDQPLFREQLALARSKSGDHFQAIAALKELVRTAGPTPERYGLIGGRYKRLWRAARKTAPADHYLDLAIEAYEAGRVLDLNDYYASSNLPLLLRHRDENGDDERARRIATCVVAACERALQLGTADEWVYPTLLVAAFNAGDVDKASALTRRVESTPRDWKLESCLEDLLDSLQLQPAGATREALVQLAARIRACLPGSA